MRRPAQHTNKSRQRGVALMLMLVVMVMGIAAVLISSLSTTALKNEQQQKTAEALAQAKDALIGYAITYSDTHSTPTPQVFGYMPCPDPNGILGGVAGEGSSETCGSKNVSSIGRLPWKSLKLSTQRDGIGECLWYAVAGTYKNNPSTDFMNWDTHGLFEVVNTSGNTIASDVVAIVFAPGPPLDNQSRAPDGSAPTCGGNYTASNYLDSNANLGINNASPSTTAKTSSQFIVSSISQNFNDQLVFITARELFDKIKRRNDFATFVATLLSSATTCLSSSLPDPVNINFDTLTESTGTSIGKLIAGRIPYTACSSNFVRQWRDNLLYAKCVSGTCRVNGIDCAHNGIVIFAGERSAGQSRNTSADKNNWSNYLEDSSPSSNILTTFSSGETIFSGAASYTATAPSTDVLACIPIPPP